MTINDVRATITKRLLALNAVDQKSIETDGFLLNPKADQTWLRLTIQFNAAGITTLGGSGVATRRNRMGVAYVNVFTPMSKGVAINDNLCDVVFKEFEGQWADPCIRYGQPTGVRIETSGRDESWYLQTVVIPFTAEVVY